MVTIAQQPPDDPIGLHTLDGATVVDQVDYVVDYVTDGPCTFRVARGPAGVIVVVIADPAVKVAIQVIGKRRLRPDQDGAQEPTA